MSSLRHDLRFALRLHLKRPGLTAVAVLSMALGAGVATAAFGVLYGLLLRPLPFRDSDRLVAVSAVHDEVVWASGSVSYPDFLDFQREGSVFAGVEAHRGAGSLVLAGPEGPERIDIDAVSAGLFPLLGVDPMVGRHFLPQEDRPDRPGVLLLSHALWQRRFHGDLSVVGRTIQANGKPHLVVGVMPPGFQFPDLQEAWVPLRSRWAKGSRSERIVQVLARLRPGVPLPAAQAEVDGIARRLTSRFPESHSLWSVRAEPIRRKLVPPDIEAPFRLAAAAAAGVLLLACANVGGLLLTLGDERRRELAVRAALGAGRGRIVRQLLTENLLLALAGGALGLLLSAWWLGAAARTLAARAFWLHLRADGPVLLFALAVSVGSALLFGLVPAVQAARIDLRRTLKDGGLRRSRHRRDGSQAPRSVLSGLSGLVTGEVALALVLLIGASLVSRSYFELRSVDPGFPTTGLVSLWTTLQNEAYADLDARGRKAEEIALRVAAIPDIEAAAVGPLPLFGGTVHERVGIETGRSATVKTSGVTPRYFRTLGIPLLSGRAFTEQESTDNAPVAVVSQAFAERLFPGVSPIGKTLRRLDREPGARVIVGVSGDVRANLWLAPEPQLYVPPRADQLHSVVILARSRLDRDELQVRINKAVREAGRDLPLYNVEAADEVIDASLAVDRLVAQGFALFGAIALFLATIGLYGVLSASVSQRLRELGIRIALGARRRHVLRLVLWRGLAMTLAGTAIGLAAAFASTHLLEKTLFGVGPTDPATFAGVSLILVLIAFAACWGPARRAMDADPVEAIRSE